MDHYSPSPPDDNLFFRFSDPPSYDSTLPPPYIRYPRSASSASSASLGEDHWHCHICQDCFGRSSINPSDRQCCHVCGHQCCVERCIAHDAGTEDLWAAVMWARPLDFAVVGQEGNLPLVWDLTTPFVPLVDVESLPEDLGPVTTTAGGMEVQAAAVAERGAEVYEGYEGEQMFFPMDELSEPEEGRRAGVALAEADRLVGNSDLLHNRPESSSEDNGEGSV